ncbi:MAG: M28 family metallopeptidase [Candidatus Hodarchaeota archaeon]
MEQENEIKKHMRFIIQDICDKIGPRAPCSQKEAECANYIENELKKYTEDTRIENFYCHPGSYKATFRIPMLNLIISTIFYWLYFFNPNVWFLISSLIFVSTSVIIIQFNLLRNIELIDPFFKKKKSSNVLAKFKPENKTKRIIIIGGHHDSNYEFKILKKSPILFGIFMAFSVIFNHLMLGVFVLKIVLHIKANYYLFIQEIDLIFLIILSSISPILVYTAINIISNTPVMGADDNLSAIAVLMSVAQFLRNNKLKNIEIWIVSHGCEEWGDRGSKRFSKKHYNELNRHNALTINLDMIGGKGQLLKLVTSESIFIVKHFKELISELSKICEDLKIPYLKGSIEAYTDSMAYSQNKINACSIISMPKKGFPTHYHTTNDTIEKIDFNNLWNCYQILIEFIKKIDADKILI